MPRTPAQRIANLDTYGEDTMTPRQAADLLEIDVRAVRGLIRCGVLECEPRGSREYYILTASVRSLDLRQRAPRRIAS